MKEKKGIFKKERNRENRMNECKIISSERIIVFQYFHYNII